MLNLKYFKNKNSGFTLIELLVVVAIIGVLASVVLASLNSARSKGNDAAVKANLSSIRANAELQYDNMGGCYSNTGTACSATTPAAVTPGACPASGAANIFGLPSIAQQIAGAKSASGGFNACGATVGGGAWAVSVQLRNPTTGLKSWCVDSSGASREVTNTANSQAGVSATISSGSCIAS